MPEKLASFHLKMISESEQRDRTTAAKPFTRPTVTARRVHLFLALFMSPQTST